MRACGVSEDQPGSHEFYQTRAMPQTRAIDETSGV